MQLQDKGHNHASYSFGVIPLFNLNFKVEWWPQTDEHWYRMRCSCFKFYFDQVSTVLVSPIELVFLPKMSWPLIIQLAPEMTKLGIFLHVLLHRCKFHFLFYLNQTCRKVVPPVVFNWHCHTPFKPDDSKCIDTFT